MVPARAAQAVFLLRLQPTGLVQNPGLAPPGLVRPGLVLPVLVPPWLVRPVLVPPGLDWVIP